jgi:hypothetical protein
LGVPLTRNTQEVRVGLSAAIFLPEKDKKDFRCNPSRKCHNIPWKHPLLKNEKSYFHIYFARHFFVQKERCRF